ncbi:MAG: hypothetical protein LJE91_17675 [Gammaproteobacteria bacterium]|nr:hypothetical protein [Gammaproteobacteria bacterium]
MDKIQFSAELVTALQKALADNDDRARDPFIAIQYLAAVIGFMVGREPLPSERKLEVNDELCALMKHVLEDVDGSRQRQTPQAEAFGIWKPGA